MLLKPLLLQKPHFSNNKIDWHNYEQIDKDEKTTGG